MAVEEYHKNTFPGLLQKKFYQENSWFTEFSFSISFALLFLLCVLAIKLTSITVSSVNTNSLYECVM